MRQFKVEASESVKETYFDRQELLPWWDQKRLREARVLVVGGGAVGNEVLKNLALLGIGHIFVADFDRVEISNLSRTVLFRESDIGRRKAECAAARTAEIALERTGEIAWFHGDITHELGTGVFRGVDLVLGCVDNIEARCTINRRCWESSTPWIDSGIHGLGVRISLFMPPRTACYECNLSNEQRAARRARRSCDDFKREVASTGGVPTVQVAAALVGALQAQEAIKYLCGNSTGFGKRFYYQGLSGQMDSFSLVPRKDCAGHSHFPTVALAPFSRSVTVREFLEYVGGEDRAGSDSAIDLRGEAFEFVASAPCRGCGRRLEFFRPNFAIHEQEVFCGLATCGKSHPRTGSDALKESVSLIKLQGSDPRILSMAMWQLGFGFKHIVQVRRSTGSYDYYELNDLWDDVFIRIYGAD
jgi:molybdopterin-synthase adenylyltransferase